MRFVEEHWLFLIVFELSVGENEIALFESCVQFTSFPNYTFMRGRRWNTTVLHFNKSKFRRRNLQWMDAQCLRNVSAERLAKAVVVHRHSFTMEIESHFHVA